MRFFFIHSRFFSYLGEMYFAIIVLFLSFLSFYELGKNRSCNENLYLFVLLVMTLLLCFRFGQGTDYFNYYNPYELEVGAHNSYFHKSLSHTEWGWYAMLLTIRKLDIPFECFIAFVSVVMMFSLYRVLKLSPYKMTSLLLFFPTYYLTYCFSALRQGLAVCLFLGFGLKLLLEGKVWRYCIFVILLGLIHSAALILLILPIVLRFSEKQLTFFAVLAFIGSFVLSRLPLFKALAFIGERAMYLEEAEFSMGAMMIRMFLFYIIWRLHHLGEAKDSVLFREECKLFKLYFSGVILFLLFSFFGIISQRLSMPMKTLEIVLIPVLFYRNRALLFNYKKTRFQEIAVYMVLIIMMMNVECLKNVNSYIDQQGYHGVSLMNYPYISVFDEERLLQYTYSL